MKLITAEEARKLHKVNDDNIAEMIRAINARIKDRIKHGETTALVSPGHTQLGAKLKALNPVETEQVKTALLCAGYTLETKDLLAPAFRIRWTKVRED